MCGIAGFATATAQIANPSELLTRLERDLFHRGPDDQGQWLGTDAKAGLVATRLAILDLSSAGHQPMESSDGRYVIAFNGEIYNYRELRAQLADRGHQFRGHSDTEVALALYAERGAGMLNELRGMFAFAVWDKVEHSCFLARDPLGIKPLYYYTSGKGALLLFASELKPLIASGLLPKRLNPEAVYAYFRSGSVPEPLTLMDGLRCLEAGSWMKWRSGEIQQRKYWELRFGERTESHESEGRGKKAQKDGRLAGAAENTRAALLDSVEKHFVSDVPVGLFLSGGIDSTAILALSKVTGRENLQTFSIGVASHELDESGVAARTAKQFGTRHEVMQLNAATATTLLEGFLRRMDQPSVDGFNTFAVSHFAHSRGMKVVLSGLGGDELFGGYASFARVPQMLKWGRTTNAIRPLIGAAGRLLERTASRSNIRRLGDFLESKQTLESAHAAFRGVFTRREAAALTRAVSDHDVALHQTGGAAVINDADTADAVSRLEITRYMRNQLLRDSDVMSMANSLELRVPLVDRELYDRVSAIPAAMRLRAGKQLLLEAVPEVPRWVAEAPKRGFRLPFELWIDQWAATSDTATRAGVRLDEWYQRWTVFVFERWVADVIR